MDAAPEPRARKRGSQIDPPNRFERTRLEADGAHAAPDEAPPPAWRTVPTKFVADHSRSLVVENDSPDIGFRYSINPYRGCEHGCSYCYARPGHEYLGLNAGLDFETVVLVKERAPELLAAELSRPSWRCEPINISGVTDCYQPAEARYRLTRGCLEVMLEARQPATLVTKNALILRDLDVLSAMAGRNLVHVHLSINTLDAELARTLEPRTTTPAGRLRAVRRLADAGVPVGVIVAPIIPGLNDKDIPAVLAAAAEAGAMRAGYVMLRLPWSVKPVFLEWLHRERPLAAGKVEARIRDVRGGRLNSTEFGDRMRGTGIAADQIEQMFRVFAARHGLDRPLPALDCSDFRPPAHDGQMRLF
jgi:DNA repair photolyase